MKIFTNKEVSKKIIIAILLVMSFNFITPTISKADFGGALFKPISQLICTIGDFVMEGLQTYFVGFEGIKQETFQGTGVYNYYIRYSPGIIFSGNVAGLKVNFINAKETDSEQIEYQEKVYRETSNTDSYYVKDGRLYFYGSNPRYYYIKGPVKSWFGGDGENNSFNTQQSQLMFYEGSDGNSYALLIPYKTGVVDDIANELAAVPLLGDAAAWLTGVITGDDSLSQAEMYETNGLYYDYLDLNGAVLRCASNEWKEGQTIDSSAYILQPVIASWYISLRAITLVGLLSVLVYIGIRIILSSTGQEKAKYKKMIGNWLAAICILFILQYIMLFITDISEKISEMLSVNIFGPRGEDIFVSKFRSTIDETGDFSDCFFNLIIYIAMVIHTVLFTIQYCKRLIYMAFLTIIAPLIALTYPLDKIKDGQAQAFSMWLREYIFNALLQPMHLLLYYIFISSASNLVDSNPIYAVVAIGFLVPAEKFFRKMFGFDKASSASQMGAAAGGALIMNAINKMGHRSGKQASAGDSGSGKASSVRMASSNAVQIGTGNGGSAPGGANPAPGGANPAPGGTNPAPGGTNPAPGGTNPAPGGTNPAPGGTNPAPGGTNPAPGGTNPAPGGTNPAPGGVNGSFGTTRRANTHGPTMARTLGGFKKGVGAVRRRYINKNTAKKVGRLARRGALGAFGAATLGTVGLAAGLYTGDFGNVLKYGAAGVGAGYLGANYLGDKAVAGEKNLRETFKEGAIGQNEYNNLKLDKQFFESNEFRSMLNNHDIDNKLLDDMGVPGKTRGAKLRNAVQIYRDNGITDTGKISAAMKAGLSPQEGAYALKLAEMIGRSGWNNPSTRKDFETRYKSQIPGNSGDKIWNSIEDLL